jgi:GH25 family lysozyme M1 (1,4-beta-N-acetylmuramidase)
MRSLTDREKEIIGRIIAEQSKGTVSMQSFLESFYFMESKGRALILQTQSYRAVLFLLAEIYNDDTARQNEIAAFFELITLLNYLKKEGFITLYRSVETRKKPIFYIQDYFLDPAPSAGPLILNAKGDYTSAPDTIHDKNKTVKYIGITLDLDTFDLVAEVTVGTMHSSDSLAGLLNTPVPVTQTNTVAEKPATPTESPAISTAQEPVKATPETPPATLPIARPLPRRNLHVILIAAAAAIIILGMFAFVYLELKSNEKSIQDIAKAHEQIKKDLKKIATTNPRAVPKDSLHDIEEARHHYGVDISHWNGNLVVKDPLPDSLTFAICKATDGTSSYDHYFSRNWVHMKERGLVRGAYHFYEFPEDPITQANHYLNTLGPLEETDIAPILDIEYLGLPEDFSKSDLRQLHTDVVVFLRHVEAKTGRKPIIYASADFAHNNLNDTVFSKYPLWLAYHVKNKNLQSPPHIPHPWKNYKVWQRSPLYYIDAENVDLDVYYGKKADLLN